MMEADTLSNAAIVDHINPRFACVRLRKDDELFEKTFHGTLTPAAYIVTAEGEFVASIVGFLEAAPYKEQLTKIEAAWKRMPALRKAIAANGDDIDARFGLGEAYFDLNRDDEARPEYEKTVRLIGSPETAERRRQIAVCHYKLAAYAT